MDVKNMELTVLGSELAKMARTELKTLCDNLCVRDLHKVIMAMNIEFDTQSESFMDKKNRSAGLRSRKVTASMQTVFLAWRKKTIAATNDFNLVG